MNCKQFDDLVSDLAGDRLMDAMVRRQLLAHSSMCAKCATRLDKERRLTQVLSSLAEQTERTKAAPALKAKLMNAFAAQQPTVSGPQSVPVQASHADHVQSRPGQQIWLLAAAALILAVLTVATLYLRSASDLEPNLVRKDPTPAVRAEASPSPAAPANQQKPAEPKRAKPSPTRIQRSRPASLRSLGAPTVASNNTEQTTDYIPLTYLADASGAQSGVVVRVEIPRNTLLAMGLPVNTERGNSLVKADVVVSDDGVARAIRLVH
ncbi:MAG: hypothetical protein ABI882_03235 [Acidobacteriota bacterium]